MSEEAEEFFRQKTIENAKRPRMKKFLALVNREEEGKILEEYHQHKLTLTDVGNCQFEAYATFCIECDRKGMKPLKYKDYLKIG